MWIHTCVYTDTQELLVLRGTFSVVHEFFAVAGSWRVPRVWRHFVGGIITRQMLVSLHVAL